MNQRFQQVDFPYEQLLAIGYHSAFNGEKAPVISGMMLLPLKTRYRGPANPVNENETDVIDEAINVFRPALFYNQYKIKGEADRTLMYLFLYLIECCKQLHGMTNKTEAYRKLRDFAIQKSLPIPGEARFPLNDFFDPPKNSKEEETLQAYLQQLRQECGDRLVNTVFRHSETAADKHWTMFGKRRFINRCFNP
uniref:Actin-related protein 2/3 complex subunit 3 n=1 Tax=Panagrolaimus sp. ES5 TaxID=591445 RepID=A0AC34F3G3_9BILA